MKINDIINEARSNAAMNPKLSLRQQIDAIIKKNGGTINDYWISSTTVDHLGFYGGDKNAPNPATTRPGRAMVTPTQAFKGQTKYMAPEFATYGKDYVAPPGAEQKYGIWFMTLKSSLPKLEQGTYPYMRNFVFLVKVNDDAWLQPVDSLQRLRTNLIGIRPPAGKHKVGQFNANSDIAVFFEPAYKIVGKWNAQEIANNSRRELWSPEGQRQAGLERSTQRAQQSTELDNLFK